MGLCTHMRDIKIIWFYFSRECVIRDNSGVSQTIRFKENNERIGGLGKTKSGREMLTQRHGDKAYTVITGSADLVLIKYSLTRCHRDCSGCSVENCPEAETSGTGSSDGAVGIYCAHSGKASDGASLLCMLPVSSNRERANESFSEIRKSGIDCSLEDRAIPSNIACS